MKTQVMQDESDAETSLAAERTGAPSAPARSFRAAVSKLLRRSRRPSRPVTSSTYDNDRSIKRNGGTT